MDQTKNKTKNKQTNKTKQNKTKKKNQPHLAKYFSVETKFPFFLRLPTSLSSHLEFIYPTDSEMTSSIMIYKPTELDTQMETGLSMHEHSASRKQH